MRTGGGGASESLKRKLGLRERKRSGVSFRKFSPSRDATTEKKRQRLRGGRQRRRHAERPGLSVRYSSRASAILSHARPSPYRLRRRDIRS